MIKKLTKHGNSYALILDRALLELLDIKADTPLLIRTDGHALIVVPTPKADRQEAFDAALEEINRKYKNLFARLA